MIAPRGRSRGLRRTDARGWPHRALRARRPRTRLRVPLPGRQRGHRVVRLPVRAPDRGPGLAREQLQIHDAAGLDRLRESGLARSCAATARSSPTSASCTPGAPDFERCPAVTPSCSAPRSGSTTGRAKTGSPTSTRASTSSATCAPGRSRSTGGAALRERFGERWFERRRPGVAARAVAPGPAAPAAGAARRTLDEQLDFAARRLISPPSPTLAASSCFSIASRMLLRALPRFSWVRTLRSSAFFRSGRRDLICGAVSWS